MDDFGTGYSSLGHLHQFPIDQIKIDRTFTSSMLSNKNNMGLVRSIVLMGHELGLNVVAEGIETTEQMSRLGELGCEYGQGYYLSKPLRVSEVNGFLTRGDHK
jgi:EAL domain-containing protein (putative c-di-GMP-specific phosphodiesterase class I)